MQEIIIATISAVFPMVTTIVTSSLNAKTARMNAAKSSILQLIMEDRMDWRDGKFPRNYQAVLHEFDIYTKAGGNSYVKERVEEYKKWYADIEKQHKAD